MNRIRKTLSVLTLGAATVAGAAALAQTAPQPAPGQSGRPLQSRPQGSHRQPAAVPADVPPWRSN